MPEVAFVELPPKKPAHQSSPVSIPRSIVALSAVPRKLATGSSSAIPQGSDGILRGGSVFVHTLLVKDGDIPTGEVNCVRSAEARNCSSSVQRRFATNSCASSWRRAHDDMETIGGGLLLTATAHDNHTRSHG